MVVWQRPESQLHFRTTHLCLTKMLSSYYACLKQVFFLYSMLTNRENGQSCLTCNWDLTHGHEDDKAIINYLQKWKQLNYSVKAISLWLCLVSVSVRVAVMMVISPNLTHRLTRISSLLGSFTEAYIQCSWGFTTVCRMLVEECLFYCCCWWPHSIRIHWPHNCRYTYIYIDVRINALFTWSSINSQSHHRLSHSRRLLLNMMKSIKNWFN